MSVSLLTRAPLILEAAIDSLPDALAAERAGAGRLELCANLLEGGTTPSIGVLRAVVARVRIPVFAIIRPRGGDFLYSADEIEVMLRDVEAAKSAGVHGIVGGALHANGAIDEDGTEAMLEAASPLPFTFHRAFDLTRDLEESLDALIALGAARVLTSGGSATALAGSAVIRRLVLRAGDRLTLIAGGGVRSDHVRELVNGTGVREVHMGPRRAAVSGMRHHTPAVKVAKTSANGWMEADDAAIAAAVLALAT
ncbi:MAG: copper homeostasis protein CutC [Gemmatimonadaceae bacterium]